MKRKGIKKNMSETELKKAQKKVMNEIRDEVMKFVEDKLRKVKTSVDTKQTNVLDVCKKVTDEAVLKSIAS